MLARSLKTIFTFSFLVTVSVGIHELAHMLAALKLGVAVKEFSIGLGYALYSWQVGAVKYSISMIPLGGYLILDTHALAEASLIVKSIVLLVGPLANMLMFFVFYPLYIALIYEVCDKKTGQEFSLRKKYFSVLWITLCLTGKLFIRFFKKISGKKEQQKIGGPLHVIESRYDTFGKIEDGVFDELILQLTALNFVMFFINLMPVPPLDGGQVLLYCLTAIFGPLTLWDILLRYSLLALCILYLLFVIRAIFKESVKKWFMRLRADIRNKIRYRPS